MYTKCLPQFSRRPRCVQDERCASHGTHRQNHDGSRIPRMRTYDKFRIDLAMFICYTYSLLEDVRGAGMSHRTRRPYLEDRQNLDLSTRSIDRDVGFVGVWGVVMADGGDRMVHAQPQRGINKGWIVVFELVKEGGEDRSAGTGRGTKGRSFE